MKKFHFLDGFKIGGIENQAFTLASLKTSKADNFLINLNKIWKQDGRQIMLKN